MAKTNEDRALPLACRNFPSPVGQLRLVASDAGLRAVLWEREPAGRVRLPEAETRPDHPILVQTARELTEYFRRGRQSFTIALDREGTPFQLAVWQYLAAIPFGETRTYVDVARDLGQPGAARAVGAANGRNPVSIVVPCHRVVGASGKLTGFAGGLDAKAYLLQLEQPPNLFPVEAVA